MITRRAFVHALAAMSAIGLPRIGAGGRYGRGPWESEPDVWQGEVGGYAVAALRSRLLGSWCGYVRVPRGHPWHGCDYNQIDPDDVIDVHGGVTYLGPRMGCGDGWWIGFDCAHSGDSVPSWQDLGRSWPGDRYRTLEYVLMEIGILAGQVDNARRR